MGTQTYQALYRLNGSSGDDKVTGSDLITSGSVVFTETSNNSQLSPGEAVTFQPIQEVGSTLYFQGTMKFGNTIVPVFSSAPTGGLRYVANTANSSPGNGTGQYTAASLLTPFVFCFLSGTSISTPHGSVPIQDLEVGQLIHTNNGPKPVRFVSRSAYQPYMLDLSESLPIRIQACALGAGLPCEDLYVSGDHAILVEEHLVHASALVNGATISRTSIDDWEPSNSIVYYNIELDEHAIIVANGLKAESFIDNAPRKTWDNYEEYQALYGEEHPIQEMSLPRVKFARQLGSSLRLTLRQNALTGVLPKKERELAAV